MNLSIVALPQEPLSAPAFILGNSDLACFWATLKRFGMNYYRRYIGDYRRDTGTLTLTDHGVYTLILDEYYAQLGVIPRHLSELNILCRANTKAEKESVMRVAERFFPTDDSGVRRNRRADEELEKSLRAIDKMKLAGIEGNKKRWREASGGGSGTRSGRGSGDDPSTNHHGLVQELTPRHEKQSQPRQRG